MPLVCSRGEKRLANACQQPASRVSVCGHSTHRHTLPLKHTHALTLRHSCTHTLVQAYGHTCTHTLVPAYRHTQTFRCTHKQPHTQIDTHLCTHTHPLLLMYSL